MPWNREQYPTNWEALAGACKERANWHCERCGVAHGAVRSGKKRGKAYTVHLAAAHLHHDPANPSPQLIALCQRCHLVHDRFLHGAHARRTRSRKKQEAMRRAGQLPLWEEEAGEAALPEEKGSRV